MAIHHLVIIFHYFPNESAAEVTKKINSILDTRLIFDFVDYPKFPNHVKLSTQWTENKISPFEYAIINSQKLGYPWLVTYFDDQKELEMIYNNDKTSNPQIRWAQWLVQN